MTYRTLCAMLAWLCASLMVCPATWAAPKSRSVADYDAFLKSMDADIEAKVKEIYKDDEANLDLLAKPLELNQKVVVHVRKGPQYVEQVEGTFYELNIEANPPYVKIGYRRLYWNDVIETDQKRLYWGAQKDRSRLVILIEKERRELEEKKDQVRRVERNSRLEEAGYTKEWLSRQVKLNGFFHERTELGDQTMDITLEVDSANPLVKVTIANHTKQPSVATVYFDRKPVGTNLPAEFSTEFPNLVWDDYSFWMLKDDLGKESASATIARKFRVDVMADKVGRWFLAPNTFATGGVKTSVSNEEVCPLCYGTGEIPAFNPAVDVPAESKPDGAKEDDPAPAKEGDAKTEAAPDGAKTEAAADGDGAAAGTAATTPAATAETIQKQFQEGARPMMVCPRCQGQKTIPSAEPHQIVRITHRLKLLTQNMEDYSAAAASKYIASARRVTEYQQKVDELVAGIKAEAMKQLVQEEQESREERERLEKERREKMAKEQFYEAIRKNYNWLTADEAIARGDIAADVYKTNLSFDNVNFPKTSTNANGKEQKVIHFSEWAAPKKTFDLRSRKPRYQLFSLQYRILEVEKTETEYAYLFQYRVDVDTTSMFEPLKLKLSVSVSLKGDDATAKDLTNTCSFTLPPTRVSTAFCTFPVETSMVGTGFADINLEASPE